MLVLDTATLPERDRREALVSTLRETSGASRVTLEDPEPVTARLDLWVFGNAAIFRTASTGVAMLRTAKAARSASGEHVAIGVQEFGIAHHREGSAARTVSAGSAVVIDVARPFEYRWRSWGAARSLNVAHADLALPIDVVVRAGTRLATSPLHRLVLRHIADLTRDADALSAGPGAEALGTASVELVRALIVTAGDGAPNARDVLEQTLITQVRAYVRQHLTDVDLTPESIAAALSVSPRHLYRACAAANLRLEPWIIERRLERAKAELGHPASRHRTIAGIARRWGFRDPTHFSRRFREAYGVLPSEWRRMCAEER